jgi:hypothetical protein
LRTPGALAVIYGGIDGKGVVFEGVAEALRVPGDMTTQLQLADKEIPMCFKWLSSGKLTNMLETHVFRL